MGSPGKTSNTATVQAITTRIDLIKGAGPQAVRRTLVQKRKPEEQQKAESSSSSISSSGNCTVRRPQTAGKPKVGLSAAKMFAHAVRMGMGQRHAVYVLNAMLKRNAKETATRPKACQTLSERSP